MERCKACELAIYCYSDSSTWVFRTKQEMDEKQAAMTECPMYGQAQKVCSGKTTNCETQAV